MLIRCRVLSVEFLSLSSPKRFQPFIHWQLRTGSPWVYNVHLFCERIRGNDEPVTRMCRTSWSSRAQRLDGRDRSESLLSIIPGEFSSRWGVDPSPIVNWDAHNIRSWESIASHEPPTGKVPCWVRYTMSPLYREFVVRWVRYTKIS